MRCCIFCAVPLHGTYRQLENTAPVLWPHAESSTSLRPGYVSRGKKRRVTRHKENTLIFFLQHMSWLSATSHGWVSAAGLCAADSLLGRLPGGEAETVFGNGYVACPGRNHSPGASAQYSSPQTRLVSPALRSSRRCSSLLGKAAFIPTFHPHSHCARPHPVVLSLSEVL